MAKKSRKELVRGAPSVASEDQVSFVDEHGRRGTHFSGGRKTEELEYVGAPTPDTDPDVPRGRAR